jgi:hypothetical protein
MLKALIVNGAEDLAGGENWRCLNGVEVDSSQWAPQSGNVFRRALNFVPMQVVDGNTTLTLVADAAAITASGPWAFDANPGGFFALHRRTRQRTDRPRAEQRSGLGEAGPLEHAAAEPSHRSRPDDPFRSEARFRGVRTGVPDHGSPGRHGAADAMPLLEDLRLDPKEPVLSGAFSGTEQQGSCNVTVTVSGTVPRSGLRFARKDQVSVLVR